MRNQYYEYRHVVGLEETDLVGTVYEVNYARWLGRCRELFLLEHAPSVLDELQGDLQLYTIRSEREQLAEISAFDEVSIRMRVDELTQTQIGFAFDYVRVRDGVEELTARSRQQVACVRDGNGAATARVPAQLGTALQDYVIVPTTYPSVAGTGGRG